MSANISYLQELEADARRMESEGRVEDAEKIREKGRQYVAACKQIEQGTREYHRTFGPGRHGG